MHLGMQPAMAQTRGLRQSPCAAIIAMAASMLAELHIAWQNATRHLMCLASGAILSATLSPVLHGRGFAGAGLAATLSILKCLPYELPALETTLLDVHFSAPGAARTK